MAKEGGKVEKELNKNDNVLKGRCFISCNSNSWCTSKIMKLWYKNIWEKYINSFNLELDDKSMMILDKASSHLSTDFKNEINAKILYLNIYHQA